MLSFGVTLGPILWQLPPQLRFDAKRAARGAAWSRGGQPSTAALAAPTIAPARKPRDVFVYFDNDAKVRAPFDALALRAKLRGEAAPAHPPSLAEVREEARVVWPAIASRVKRGPARGRRHP